MYRPSLSARVTRMTLHPSDGDRLFFFDHKTAALWAKCYRNQNCELHFSQDVKGRTGGFVKKVP